MALVVNLFQHHEQSGYDPLNPPVVEGAKVDTSTDGTAVGGTTMDAVRGRRAKAGRDAKQQQANDQVAVNKSAELEADYKKAFAVCMEGKGYAIK